MAQTPPEGSVAGASATLTPEAPAVSAFDGGGESVFDLEAVSVFYGATPAVRDVSMSVAPRRITALIGPSGCGKSTLLRCLNRMNDLVPSAHVEGRVLYHGQDLYERGIDPVEVRKRIGMVFQKPNPFPKSIYDNVAFGPRVLRLKDRPAERVERALRRAALWDEVKDRLHANAYSLSGGQQQRLCLARALAIDPDVILMDEPCSALDPISTSRIEDLMLELRKEIAIVIVTHNMQQAARVSQMTAFLTVAEEPDVAVEAGPGEPVRAGRIIEYDETEHVFTNPSDPRTEAYVSGRVG
jgi:phosphate transport system ATP-binding protein